LWERHIGIRVTALVRAADVIFAAGSPDIVDPDDPHGAWEGRKGGILAAFTAGDGEKLAQYKLPAPPVWDGMAAAGGRLYISTSKGGIVCMGGHR
jgi:sugar lactone lactonase YvrE